MFRGAEFDDLVLSENRIKYVQNMYFTLCSLQLCFLLGAGIPIDLRCGTIMIFSFLLLAIWSTPKHALIKFFFTNILALLFGILKFNIFHSEDFEQNRTEAIYLIHNYIILITTIYLMPFSEMLCFLNVVFITILNIYTKIFSMIEIIIISAFILFETKILIKRSKKAVEHKFQFGEILAIIGLMLLS